MIEIIKLMEAVSDGELGERVTHDMLRQKRRSMAEAIASCDEDFTEVGVRDELIRVEKQSIGELEKEVDTVTENLLRMAALVKLSKSLKGD